MPVTGNMNQDHSTQESLEQAGFVEGEHVIDENSEQRQNTGAAEVSSTTIDSDPASQVSQAVPLHGDVSEYVQSTSVDASSDSLDGFKDTADGAASKPANLSMGFQDAFAAFASASYREPEEESPMDVCNDVSDTTTTVTDSEGAVATAASDSANFFVVDSHVSSALDSGQVTTTVESLVKPEADVESVTADVAVDNSQHQAVTNPEPSPDNQLTLGTEQFQVGEQISQQPETAAPSDSVYFIQTTDASGQVVTSIIDPNDIPSYTDSVVYKQCMRPDGEIETTIVYSAGMAVSQEEQPQLEPTTASSDETDPQQGEQQIIYAHDVNGHLTPIDSVQSFNDVAPPGKQFVYMQDSTGRIIRTVMDADQTMVPGQQVYYTQSDDGRIITSVMDPATAGVSEETSQGQPSQEAVEQVGETAQSQETSTSLVGGTSNFNIDNSMSGLSMLAELSHLTAGQAFTTPGLATEHRASSSTGSSSVDQDEFRPIATVARQAAGDEGLESVGSDIAGLKVGEADSDSLDQSPSPLEGGGSGQEETLITKIVSHMDEQAHASYTVSRDNLFVQWQNLDSMCWMDVVLIMLVNSPSLRLLVNLDPAHELSSTLLITLLKANKQAQILLQNILKKSNGAEISSLQTGAGNSATTQDPKTSKLVCKENMDEIGKAINILYAMREKIWQALQPRLRCERGKHNSPVLVLPLIVREKPEIKQMFTMNYRYVFKCKQCGYFQDDCHTKILPSIPAVPDDFSMQAPSFVRNCFECQAPNQRMLMKFEVLHDFVQMHFVKGLPHSTFEELSFDFNDDHYEVTAVIHYKNSPDHFIAWVRNAPGPAWMECDDLKSVITCYSSVPPNIPPSQVHMVMWERRLNPQHTLVMRDTEDTKLLASLVLTVQQPSTQQSADQVARQSGVPSTLATPASNATPTTAQSNSTQAGSTMTQTFPAYTPRQRGRGRGGRGSYGDRGQATSTPIIRRVSPAITQLSSPSVSSSPMPHTSPQIIRLPLSTLASSGLNLRGGTPGATRYVLVGNNFQTGGNVATTSQARTTGTSKVVVVRSQGGTANISAAQLLQLLQRSGAISQSGSRITTTITTAGANSDGTSAASSTSYIIQQDGSVVASPTNAEMTAGQVSLERTTPGQIAASTTLLDSSNEQGSESYMATESLEASDNEQMKSSFTASQTISTLPYVGTAASALGQSPRSSAITQSPQLVTSSASQLEPSSVSLGDMEVPGDQQAASGQAVSLAQSQHINRYIQVPNPAGGGTLFCQLGMRDGKMVLVPVDKTAQTQVGSTSVLKLSTNPTSSPKITIRVPATSSQVSATSSSSAAVLAQMLQGQSSSSGVTTGHRFITLPGTSGNKKIQLITVPRGVAVTTSTTQTNQASTKTFVSSQQTVPSTPSIVTRLVSPVSADNRTLSQSGNIVVHELQRNEGEGITALAAASPGTAGRSGDPGAGRVISTQTVSVFRDVPARLATSSLGMSLLGASPSKQHKTQENFRYILPGSNTTHILHTGGMQGGLGPAGRAFTALSSSGTIIGGQLTPSPTSASVETSPMDQDLAMGDSDDSNQGSGVLSAKRHLSRDLDTTEYIPLGRRGRGGHRGGRGRGGRTPRGRGRLQLWTSAADIIAPVSVSTQKVSTLADLRQIGAHVIEAGSETVDGVPVVSIPDFSTDGTGQSEILSAAQSIIPESSTGAVGQGIPGLSDMSSHVVSSGLGQESLPESLLASQGPRVITQTIPAYRNNHGFDILTQGILGSTNTKPLRQARSLLTGATTTLLTASPLQSSLAEITTLSMVSATSEVQQAMGQAEIDTLIQAAQAAAKPPAVDQTSAMDVSPIDSSDSLEMAGQPEDSDLGLTKTGNVENNQDLGTCEDSVDTADSLATQPEQQEEAGTIVSIDESQVSAAERYRMPVELFQPDEESPEKSLKQDDAASKLRLDLPPTGLFNDSGLSPTTPEITKSPQRQGRDIVQRSAGKELKWGTTCGKDEPSGSEDSKQLILESIRYRTSIEAESTNVDNSTLVESGRDEAVMEVELSTNDVTRNFTDATRGSAFEEGGLFSKAEDSADVDFRPDDESRADTSFKATEETGSVSVTPVKKVGRPRGRPRGSFSKRGRRRKSNSNHETEFSDIATPSPFCATSAASSFTPESFPGRKITPVISDTPEAQSFQHSPESSSAKYSKPDSSNASFASELLSMKSDEEKDQRTEDESPPTEIVQENQATAELPVEEKQTLNVADKSKEILVIKHVISSPAFVRDKKVKVSWDVNSDIEVVVHPRSYFSYKVLTGRVVEPHRRHPSLSPVQESFISMPVPLPKKQARIGGDKPQNVLTAVVNCRSPRPLRKPKSDPVNVATVMPLVVKDSSDPACTGGSVVSGPAGRKIFTGVVVRHKGQETDWSTTFGEELQENIEELTGEELKVAQKVYRKQLMTVLYLYAGGFDAGLGNVSDDDAQENGELKVEGNIKKLGKTDTATKEELGKVVQGSLVEESPAKELVEPGKVLMDSGTKTDLVERTMKEELLEPDKAIKESAVKEDLVEPDKIAMEITATKLAESGEVGAVTDNEPSGLQKNMNPDKSLDIVQPRKTSSSRGRPRKRRSDLQSPVPKQPPKKARPSGVEESDGLLQSPSHSADCSDIDTTESAAVTSRVNGIGTTSLSVAHLSQTTSDSETGRKDSPVSAPQQVPFHSPSRRSGRTPVPSKKVLDAWEDYPVRSALKDRRTLSQSSDDELAGYSSGDMQRKKLKTKQTFSPS